MRFLIIGGSRFLGHHLARIALDCGHEVTLFNRGNYSLDEISKVEVIRGDRHFDLHLLKNRQWDAVIDTSGYLPRAVRATAEALKDSVGCYVLVSSVSVYVDLSLPNIDETAPIETLSEEQLHKANKIDISGQVSAKTYGDLYGGLKALCEQAVESTLPKRSLIIRPGLLVGAGDYTDRFTYWVVRTARGGEVLAPGNPSRNLQLIDVRDLAQWIVRMIERKETGVIGDNYIDRIHDRLTIT